MSADIVTYTGMMVSTTITITDMSEIRFQEIGVIHSPFTTLEGMPIQPAGAAGVEGWVQVFPDYVEGLKDMGGFSHVYLIYYFHKVAKTSLTVKPFLDDVDHGVFATRAPVRPNPIGLSLVGLAGIEGDTLHIRNVDVLDGTPLLDIKPYIPGFAKVEDVRVGWLESKDRHVETKKSDHRFI
ncbi:MAG TPA: tRNA (N6-threonylcarbamoyladenosine(37)-N6)-methyltransferase TrmO [Anaerolineales bacterium]|nr:tRNA (N6-threonylcarbamoyladenosine(37)-N6)-methyltransferase TrmO [Anaerolineales bacterium]